MIRNYANLQIRLNGETQAARERMLYAVTARMDALGMVACSRENAERTICLLPTDTGWAVFDDCADRLDIGALDGLGRFLTRKLRTRGIGILCAGDGLLLRLYGDGRLRDSYITSRHAFGRKTGGCSCFTCHGHALRWRALIREGCGMKDLAEAFSEGEREGRAVLPRLKYLLALDGSADFGFSSAGDREGVITLYFCAANVVKQSLLGRLTHPARRAATMLGAFVRPGRRCRSPKT